MNTVVTSLDSHGIIRQIHGPYRCVVIIVDLNAIFFRFNGHGCSCDIKFIIDIEGITD